MEYMKLNGFKNSFSEYTELRLQENRNLQITNINGNITTNKLSVNNGVSARVYKNGSWGFSSNPVIDNESIKGVIHKATDNAYFLDSKENKNGVVLPSRPDIDKISFATKKTRISQKELIDFVNELEGYVTKTYRDLRSKSFTINCLDMEKNLMTADGSDIYSMIPRSMILILFSIESKGVIYDHRLALSELAQFEDNFETPEKLFSDLDYLYTQLKEKTEGVYPETGIQDVIIDAPIAGLLAHEAIGHTTEADFVKAGSIAADYLNRQVASPMVNLIDFANTAYGKQCPVPVYIDDEGIVAEDAVIIEDGILKNYMHNKESAAQMGMRPTGNARAFSFSDEPLIRMRNTAFAPGKSKLDDMIASIDDGYYLTHRGNGQADTTSEFMFGVPFGYKIKKGEIVGAIKDTTISGVAFDVLKTVSMVSDTMNWNNIGMCGKKQPIPTGKGGPAIKCRVNMGGK